MNFWYSAQDDEIFLDLDSHANLYRALRVLRSAMKKDELDVRGVFYYPTRRKGHGHLIVELWEPMDASLRALWALWMGSDRLRHVYVMARLKAGIERADLLTAHRPYHRMTEFLCNCKGKHKPKAVTAKCPVLRKILGDLHSADFFPRVGRRAVKSIRVPVGPVSVSRLLRWDMP